MEIRDYPNITVGNYLRLSGLFLKWTPGKAPMKDFILSKFTKTELTPSQTFFKNFNTIKSELSL